MYLLIHLKNNLAWWQLSTLSNRTWTLGCHVRFFVHSSLWHHHHHECHHWELLLADQCQSPPCHHPASQSSNILKHKKYLYNDVIFWYLQCSGQSNIDVDVGSHHDTALCNLQKKRGGHKKFPNIPIITKSAFILTTSKLFSDHFPA